MVDELLPSACVFLIFGAAVGFSHSKLLERNLRVFFPLKIRIYSAVLLAGVTSLLTVGRFCFNNHCQGHAVPMILYLIAVFLIGLGFTGRLVDVSSQKISNDPDRQRIIESDRMEWGYIALSPFSSSFYQPVLAPLEE